MIVCAGISGAAGALDFGTRVDTIRNHKDRALDELRDLCSRRKLRFTPLLMEPTSLFRVHNASDPDMARLYVKRVDREKGSVQFAPWAEGQNAITVSRALPRVLEDDNDDRLFIKLKFPPFDDARSGN